MGLKIFGQKRKSLPIGALPQDTDLVDLPDGTELHAAFYASRLFPENLLSVSAFPTHQVDKNNKRLK